MEGPSRAVGSGPTWEPNAQVQLLFELEGEFVMIDAAPMADWPDAELIKVAESLQPF